jgi:hypothetical protein
MRDRIGHQEGRSEILDAKSRLEKQWAWAGVRPAAGSIAGGERGRACGRMKKFGVRVDPRVAFGDRLRETIGRSPGLSSDNLR